MKRRATGGVFQQLDEMLERFLEQKKQVRKNVRDRFGSAAGPVYTSGSWWQCRYRGRLRRALTAKRLIELLAEQQKEPRGE